MNKPTVSKSPMKSTAVWAGGIGAAVFAARIFAGWELDTDETKGVVDNVMNMKGSIAGVVASLGVIVARFKSVNFDKSLLKNRTFWASIGKILAIVLTIIGIGDNEINMEEVAGKMFDVVTLGAATFTSVMAIYGRLKADTPLEIRKAVPVEE